jgi:diacylglycerol kinase family enzyme
MDFLQVDKLRINKKDFLYSHENEIFYIEKSKIKKYKAKKNCEYMNECDNTKSFIVLVNPKGGSGKAWKTWLDLKQHFVRRFQLVEEIRTSRADQVTELLSERSLSIDFILCIGGDGLITETINALAELKKLHIPVFPLPCGSGNGLVWSILAQAGQPLDLARAVQAILRFRVQPLDLMNVTVGDRKFVAFLSINLGLMADADIDSDQWRCIGHIRVTLCGLWKILKLHAYAAKIKLISASGDVEELTGKYTHVSIFNVSHAARDFVAAPERKLNDRLFSAVCLTSKAASRSGLVGAMLAAEQGTQGQKYAWWKPREIIGFEIESSGKGFAIDGEFVGGNHLTASLADELAYVYLP